MKSKAKKLSLFTFAILSIGSFTGCIDNDYDLDGVDMTIGIGNGEFLLPSCSTDSIRLSEVLELNESETVVEKTMATITICRMVIMLVLLTQRLIKSLL